VGSVGLATNIAMHADMRVIKLSTLEVSVESESDAVPFEPLDDLPWPLRDAYRSRFRVKVHRAATRDRRGIRAISGSLA
jgi:hypothetical protein